MSGNLAIIGKKESVMPFIATGAKVYYIKEGEAETKVEELINQGVKVIFFSEEFAEELALVLKKYQTETFPCLIPFSSGRMRLNIGIERIRQLIKKAAGADIFLEQK